MSPMISFLGNRPGCKTTPASSSPCELRDAGRVHPFAPEDCPLEGSDDSTWGTDETLTVTAHFVEEFDDIYIAIAIVIAAFISIPLIAKALRRYGLYFIEYDVSSQCLTSDKLVSRVIRKVIRWNNGRLGFEARLISFLGKYGKL